MATAIETTEQILDLLFGPVAQRSFAVRLWDGLEQNPTSCDPGFTLVLNYPWSLRRMLQPPTELSVGEAYIHGLFDIEGQMERAPGLSTALLPRLTSPATLVRLQALLFRLPTGRTSRRSEVRALRLDGDVHSLQRDGDAVRYHYDIGNDFWTHWLDRRMTYSCAYWPEEVTCLDEAQEYKLELACRKLCLQPGETLLDIGSGWGSLISYAAQRYGVQAVGITLSREQVDFSRRALAEADLGDQVEVQLLDYRQLGPDRTFDKVVSLGMVEHVGHKLLPLYFRKAYEATRPGGLCLVHGITNTSLGRQHGRLQRQFISRVWKEASFFYRYIFPDAEIPRQAELIMRGEEAGFELRDFESLREHYPPTLDAWRANLEANRDRVVEVVGEPTYRTWRFYLATCSWAFTYGRLGVAQALFSRPDEVNRTHLPRTRRHLVT